MRNIMNALIVIIASAGILTAQMDPPDRVGRLNYMDGPVSFQPAGVDDWIDLTVNRPLIPGDNIWVGDRGRAELHVGSTAMRLGANTDFQFLNLDDQVVQIRLSEGTLTVRVRYLTRNQVFEIDTPNLAFTVLRPGEYRIDADANAQSTMITVRDGDGDVTGGGQTFPVSARQQIVVRGGYDQISYNFSSARGPDAWDQWCSSRDSREEQSQSARYVSREVPGYDDLDQYGRWQNQPGYGNVWMPTSVSAGWAPYHDGHWAWIEPWGWTWVDDAPWGFAPYHYGRWASFGNRWGWVPGPYGMTPVYAPALVAWVGGGRGGSGFSLSFSIGNSPAVGWFPLGPREPYFPSYQASQGYFTRVNETNTVINNTTINNYYGYSRNPSSTAITNITYVNQTVQNAVTAVPQDNFARGRRVTQDMRTVSPSQLASAQVLAAPAVTPQRESVLGAKADTASRAGRPPANVLSRPVVARTAPPPAPVPFDRQQSALAKNPGRPLPTNAVQDLRKGGPAPGSQVRVVDMGRVKRVQPTAASGPEGGPQPGTVSQPSNGRGNMPPGRQRQQEAIQPQPSAPQPAAVNPQPPANDRRNGPPGRQRQQEATQSEPQVAPPQAAPPPAATPPPPADDRRNGPPGRQRQQEATQSQPQVPQTQATPPPTAAPQPPANDRKNGPPGRQRQQEAAQSQPQVAAPQAAPPQAAAPQPPADDRKNGPPGRQRQQEAAQSQPQAAAPQSAPGAPPQQAEPPQDKGKGKQSKSEKDNNGQKNSNE